MYRSLLLKLTGIRGELREGWNFSLCPRENEITTMNTIIATKITSPTKIDVTIKIKSSGWAAGICVTFVVTTGVVVVGISVGSTSK